MYKKLQSYVALVLCLSCIFSMLSLNTLHVRAETSYSDLLESTSPVDETAQSFSLTFDCQATSNYTDISGGTYSGSGTYSGTGSSSTTVTGSVSLGGQTATANKSYAGTVSNGSGVISTFNSSITGQTGSMSFTLPGSSGAGSTESSGNISITTTHGGSMVMHYKIPLMLTLPFVQGGSINHQDYYGVVVNPRNITTSSSTLHHITHFHITSKDGEFISDSSARPCYFVLGSELLSSNNTLVVVPLYIEFDDLIPSLTGTTAFGSTISFDLAFRLRRIKDYAQSQVGSNVTSDIKAHQLQEATNSELSDLNDTEEDTNETTHSIFDSITAFFGSFFSNLIGVFVPEDGYFTNWFNRLNNLLTDKLGILYFPFSYFIDLMTEIYTNASGGTQGRLDIVFPEIAFNNVATGERYVFLSQQTVNLRDYDMNFSSSPNSPLIGANTSTNNLVRMIRRFNNCVFVFALIKLLYAKLSLIMRGHENDN